MKILYAKYNRERLPKFQTETIVYEEKDKIFARKKALSPEAVMHIKAMYSNYNVLRNMYASVNIVNAELKQDTIIFEYVEGKSFDSLLIEAVMKNDKKKFFELLEEYKNLMFSLGIKKITNFKSCEKFKELFGCEFEMREAICFEPANIDLIFDNIIIDDENKYWTIDYEWVFDFPIPVNYAIYRSLLIFGYKYAEYVTYFIELNEMYEFFDIDEDIKKIYRKFEDNFLNYVYGSERRYLIKNDYIKDSKKIELDEIDIYTNKMTNKLQIYWSYDGTYSEENSKSVDLISNSKNNITVFLPDDISSIRIDPTNDYASIEIESIKVFSVNNNKEKLICKSSEKNNFDAITKESGLLKIENRQNYCFYSISKDPHFFYLCDFKKYKSEKYKIELSFDYSNNLNEIDYYVKELVNKHEQEINRQKNQIYKMDDECNELRIQLQTKDEQINKFDKELFIKSQEIEQLNKESFIKSQEIEQLSKQINDILGSTSWKISYPIRILGRILRCFKKKAKKIYKTIIAIDILNIKKKVSNLLTRKINSNKLILILSHTDYLNSMGGTEKYIFEQYQFLKDKGFEIIQVFPNQYYSFMGDELGKYGVNIGNNFKGFYFIEEIIKIINVNASSIKSLYIHHLRFWQWKDLNNILIYLKNKKISKIFFMHDFFSCCPSIHMIYSNNNVSYPCVIKDEFDNKLCSKCTNSQQLYEWKENFRKIFNFSSRIILPSEYVSKVFMQIYPEHGNKTLTCGHINLIETENSMVKANVSSKKIRLAYLGYKSLNKGWDTWETIIANKKLSEMYDFYHIGTNERYSQNVHTYNYSFINDGIQAAVNLLKENMIDIVLLWSVVPESYSYTLYESIAAGIPIVTNEFSGNIAYTINNSKSLGKVFSNENELIKFLLDKKSVMKLIKQERKTYNLEYNPIPYL